MSNRSSAVVLSEPLSKRLMRYVADARYILLGYASNLLLPAANRPDFEQLRTFCCFVGHGRSGGTLVGALLNAHPSIVMSNELNALRRLRTGLTGDQLYRVIYLVSHRQVLRGSRGGGGYSYAVTGQWQGRHKELHVIGDRKAGATAYEVLSNPRSLEILERKIKLEKKFFHVVRNPFDVIATTYQKTLKEQGESADEHLSREIRNFFARCRAVQLIEQKFGNKALLHVHHERLITDPFGELNRICRFLGVEADPDYLKACAGILNKSPNQSRKLLTWTDENAGHIKMAMKDFPWLASYGAQQ